MVATADKEELFCGKELSSLYVCYIPFLELLVWLGLIQFTCAAPKELHGAPISLRLLFPDFRAAFHQFCHPSLPVLSCRGANGQPGSPERRLRIVAGAGGRSRPAARRLRTRVPQGAPALSGTRQEQAGTAQPCASCVTTERSAGLPSGRGWYIRRGGWGQDSVLALARPLEGSRRIPRWAPGRRAPTRLFSTGVWRPKAWSTGFGIFPLPAYFRTLYPKSSRASYPTPLKKKEVSF